MALHIRDERAVKLAKKLAARRGTTMTQAVVDALQGALAREARPLAERLAEIAREAKRLGDPKRGAASHQAGDRRALGQRVIFVDTSALIAILAEEPDAAKFAAKIEAEAECISGGACRSRSIDATGDDLRADADDGRRTVTRALHEAGIAVVPMTKTSPMLAVAAFERYGKGRKSRAGLNFGDCLSYACAKVHGARLLFKGADFAHTDIAKA